MVMKNADIRDDDLEAVWLVVDLETKTAEERLIRHGDLRKYERGRARDAETGEWLDVLIRRDLELPTDLEE